MCGIAGRFSENENMTEKAEILEKMSLTLCRRGPDEHGEFIDKTAAMLHRRLTVIDPDHGKQPMTARFGDKSVVLIYNGELYNCFELRRELASYGAQFSESSDTEVLLKAYLQWGEHCVEKLNGIFAFAVYDQRSKSMFLARDPVGVKPLFYF